MRFFPHRPTAGPSSATFSAPLAHRSRRAAFGAGLVAALLTATACTAVVDGTAQRPPGESSRPSVDVALLDTGNYATQPVPPMGVAGSPAKGGLIEAGRMAEHVVGPWEVNPELSHFVMPTSIVKDVAALKMLLPEKVAAAAAKHNFVTGFSSARRTEPDRASLVNAVLRFPDPQAAAAAAAEFGDITLQPDLMDYVPQARPVSVREHPETRASTYDLPQLGSPIMETNVNAYTAHGPFVLVQSAESPDGVDPTADMVAKTLDQQIAAIDAFTPTAVSELANLPVDASGVLARTVPEIKENPPPGVNQTYGPHAAPHFQTFPQTSAELFADTGMDVWSRGRAAVYRVRDEQSAANMLEQFATELTDAKGQAVASVPNMPDSRCIRREAQLSTYVTCFAVADRYVIEAASPQPTDAHQLTAAQYVMLTAP